MALLLPKPRSMPIGAHVPSPPKPAKNQEEVEVDDAVQIDVKGQLIEAAVIQKRGLSIRVMFENRIDTKWCDATELKKIIKGGAAELMSRAEKAAQAAAEAAAKKKAAEEAAAAEKAAAEAAAAAKKAEEKRIFELYKARALKAYEWCPTGKYFNLDHLPIPDHQKDVFRIVGYEIDPEKNYKRAGAPKYAPDNTACGARVFFTDGSVTPMNYGVTRAGVGAVPDDFTEEEAELKGGSKDKVCKGDGSAYLLAKQLAEDADADAWKFKVLEFKEAFDDGRTLRKIDWYPAEDPASADESLWTEIDTETMKGWVRKDEEGNWDW